MTTEKQIRLKSGVILPAGLPVRFYKDRPNACTVANPDGKAYLVRVKNAFEVPSINELEDFASDSVCPSIFGHTVEPNGWDHKGSPSWLLALGLI